MAGSRFNLQEHETVNLKNINQKRIKVGNLLIFACFSMFMLSMAVKGTFAAQTAFLKNLWGQILH